MKTWDDLSDAEKEMALEVALSEELKAIIEYGIRFNDELNGDDLQARIDRAVDLAEAQQTPWFVAEIMMEDETLADTLRGLARCAAEDALYAAPGENVIRLPVERGES